MPSSSVAYPLPLVRFAPFYPGVLGIAGAGSTRGFRTDTLGTVFYVDPNFPGVSDLRHGTEPDCPLETVQAAVDACADWHNDVVVVMHNNQWQYGPGYVGGTDRALAIDESVTVTKHGIRIVGVAPSSATGPIWRPATAGGTCLTVTGLDVLVEGFCFDGFVGGAGGRGIYAEWGAPPSWGDNLSVRHCFFSDTIDIGIQLEFAWNCFIEHNVFEACDTAGIYADPAGSAPAYDRIADNRFHDCALAISLTELTDSEIVGNRIYNSNAQAGAAATDEGIDTALGARNLVADNYLSCLLPVPAAGDYDDMNSAAATDAWVNNHCMDGDAVTNPL